MAAVIYSLCAVAAVTCAFCTIECAISPIFRRLSKPPIDHPLDGQALDNDREHDNHVAYDQDALGFGPFRQAECERDRDAPSQPTPCQDRRAGPDLRVACVQPITGATTLMALTTSATGMAKTPAASG